MEGPKGSLVAPGSIGFDSRYGKFFNEIYY